MADFVFNIAKGKLAYYAGLPAANDALIAVLLKSSGLETDATLKDYDDLAALLGGTSDEATDASYSRKTLASVSVTVDDTNDRVDIDCADITWTALAGAAIGKLVIVYDPDTTTGTDSTVVPLTAHDFAITPDGSDVTAQVSNFDRIS
jgi:hypothetical protein